MEKLITGPMGRVSQFCSTAILSNDFDYISVAHIGKRTESNVLKQVQVQWGNSPNSAVHASIK